MVGWAGLGSSGGDIAGLRRVAADPAKHRRSECGPTAAGSAVESELPGADWPTQHNPDREFDRRYDPVNVISFSCGVRTTASAVQRGIRRLQQAAATRDPDRIIEVVHIPMNFADENDRFTRIRTRAQFRRLFRRIFTEDTYRAIAALDVRGDPILNPNRWGTDFHLGGIWLVHEEEGAEPKLYSVYLDAIDLSLNPERPSTAASQQEH